MKAMLSRSVGGPDTLELAEVADPVPAKGEALIRVAACGVNFPDSLIIENAPAFGIVAGWGKYLRDVAITGNVIRKAFAGIGVSVAAGAGTVLVNNNMISESPRGAVVGHDHGRPATADLSAEGAQRYAQLVIGSNAVRR